MSIATMYAAWKAYKYITAAYSTYETALNVYGAACTIAGTTGAVVGYMIPSSSNNPDDKQTTMLIERKGDWELVELL